LGYSVPVVLDGVLVLLYRQGDEEVVEGACAETGQAQWQFRYPTAYRCPVNYSSGPYSTPVLDQDHVYAWGAEGEFHCLDLSQGTLLWSRSLSDEYGVEPGRFPVASSPLLDGDRLILNVGGRSAGAGIVALDKRTGQTLWTATGDGASCATPKVAAVHGRRVVFVWTSENLVALDPESGRVWWRIPFRANHPDTINAVSPIVSGDVILVSGYQVGSLCVRMQADGTYRELWRGKKEVLDSHYNNLLCRDGYVYGFGTVGSGLRCVELETGDLMWRWKSRLRNAASIGVGDKLILFDERGRLASVRIHPDGYQPGASTARGLLSGRCFSAPALSGGLLYVRNEEELKCLDLRGTNRAAADHGQPLTQFHR
jgi:outer membrane protein assembly factor BamB